HERCAASEPGAAAFAHQLFGRASRELEREWLPRFSQVLTTSEEDAFRVRAIAPKAGICVYPNAIPTTQLPAHGDEESIVFSGNMEYHPNRSAVRFFAAEVWPHLRRQWPRLVWRLVGKNPQAIRTVLANDPRIEVVGAVDDAIAEIARAQVAVVPLLA